MKLFWLVYNYYLYLTLPSSCTSVLLQTEGCRRWRRPCSTKASWPLFSLALEPVFVPAKPEQLPKASTSSQCRLKSMAAVLIWQINYSSSMQFCSALVVSILLFATQFYNSKHLSEPRRHTSCLEKDSPSMLAFSMVSFGPYLLPDSISSRTVACPWQLTATCLAWRCLSYYSM